jgi:hypothetical protein
MKPQTKPQQLQTTTQSKLILKKGNPSNHGIYSRANKENVLRRAVYA